MMLRLRHKKVLNIGIRRILPDGDVDTDKKNVKKEAPDILHKLNLGEGLEGPNPLIINLILSRESSHYFGGLPSRYVDIDKKNVKKETPDILYKLSLGESLEGPNPLIIDNLEIITNKLIEEYPDETARKFKKAVAEHYKVKQSNISLGNGSDDIIETLPRIFDCFNIIPVPTFFRFEDAIKREMGQMKFIQMSAEQNYSFNEEVKDEILENIVNESMIWLCNPNNPTGQPINQKYVKEIIAFSQDRNSIVVSDEAYGEFTDNANGPLSVSNMVNKYDNIIVLRTFSKAHAMAGLRVGYAISSESLNFVLEKWRLPYNVNSVAQELAILSIQDSDYIESIRSITAKRVEMLENTILENSNLDCIKGSRTNVFLARTLNGISLRDVLMKEGIQVADHNKIRGIAGENYSRITVGKQDSVDYLINVLEAQ